MRPPQNTKNNSSHKSTNKSKHEIPMLPDVSSARPGEICIEKSVFVPTREERAPSPSGSVPQGDDVQSPYTELSQKTESVQIEITESPDLLENAVSEPSSDQALETNNSDLSQKVIGVNNDGNKGSTETSHEQPPAMPVEESRNGQVKNNSVQVDCSDSDKEAVVKSTSVTDEAPVDPDDVAVVKSLCATDEAIDGSGDKANVEPVCIMDEARDVVCDESQREATPCCITEPPAPTAEALAPPTHAIITAVENEAVVGAIYPNLQALMLPHAHSHQAAGAAEAEESTEYNAPLPAPLTEEQLRSIYYNHQLEHHDEFIDSFLKNMNQDRHPFYETVLSYYRACNHLAGAGQDLAVLERDYIRYRELVWEMNEETLVAQGQCEDKTRVTAEHKYTVAVFNEASCQDVYRALKNIRCQIHDHLSLHAYEVQLARLQVEVFLDDILKANPALYDIPKGAPVTALLAHQRENALSKQVEALKTCISILFMFQRKPAKDHSFVQDTRSWLSMLIGILLRVATLEDHLFIVHHLMRCPPGVGTWAASFIQVLSPGSNPGGTCWDSPLIDSLVTMLAAILTPVECREECLYQMKVALTPPTDAQNANPWIFVDMDGEEDELGSSNWWHLSENDVVALLGQLPLHLGFSRIFNIADNDDEWANYDASTVYTQAGFFKVIAYGTCLLKLLGAGLQTYSLSRYRQLNKRIAGLIRLGSWQFLTDMPYECVSHIMMWKLLLLMHQGSNCHEDKDQKSPALMTDGRRPYHFSGLEKRPVLVQYKALIQDESCQAWFESQLTIMPTTEATFLLTTFANMAKSRPSSNHDFIETITREIFEIAYLWGHTREFCSKPGRQLLASIMTSHPWIASLLLEAVNQHMDKIGKVSVYLFKELPVHLYVPVPADLALLREWLLEFSISSPNSHLARLVIKKLAWNPSADSHLFLEPEMHRKVAILVMETYCKHLHGKFITGIFTDGFAQDEELSEDKQLASWAWRLALQLCLHSRSHSDLASQPVVDLAGNPDYQPIVQGLRDKYALAGYFSLVLGTSGHEEGEFCSEGVSLLVELVDKAHHIPTLQILQFTVPMFFTNAQALITHKSFLEFLQKLFAVDASRKSFFSEEFPGPFTKMIAAMIQTTVADAEAGITAGVASLFWLSVLTALPNWIRDKSVLYVIDILIQFSFPCEQSFAAVRQFFSELHQGIIRETKEKGVFSTLFSWLSSSAFPSLIPAQSSPEFAWFAYLVLTTEAQWQLESGVWPGLQKVLLDEQRPNLEHMLKKILSKLKLDPILSAQRLAIYRWAYQALDTPFDHLLLPLIWQQFFVHYLGRCTPEPGLPQRGSVGEKFFESTANVSLVKKMKKRLEETAAHFHQLTTSAAAMCSDNDLDNNQDLTTGNELEARRIAEKTESYRQMVGFYQTLLFWLDEPRLHEANLYLPALPDQYSPQRLVSVFHVDVTPWTDLVNCQCVEEDMKALRSVWHLVRLTECGDGYRSSLQCDDESMSSSGRILSRINKQHAPQAPPPLVRPHPPLAPLDEVLLTRQTTLIHSLRSDLSALVDHAKLYCMRVSRHVAIDMSYVELYPDLFTNEMSESILTAQCRSTFSLTHKCKGASVMHVRHKERKRNDVVSRKMDENRAEYKQLMIECCLPPSLTVCAGAVQIENTITRLINQMKSSQDPVKKGTLCEVGTALFYHIATYISDDTKYYPPTCQFFSFCIEVLGQEFIRDNPSQAQPLLQTILQMPSLTGLLSPNFCPNANPELFVAMYEDMIEVPQVLGADIAFTLLTKFEMRSWLSNSNPSLAQRSALIGVLERALNGCGSQPPDDLEVVCQIYRRHLQHIMQHKFPDHFGEILKLIVRGCEQSSISSEVLTDFLLSLGVDGSSRREFHIGDTTMFCVQSQLSHTILVETMEWLASYFMQLRLGSSETATFGLYPAWKPYIEGLSSLLGFLATRCVTTMIGFVKTKGMDAELAIGELWEKHASLFAPWAHPVEYNGALLYPCILSDIESAEKMVTHWVQVIECSQIAFEDVVPPFCQSSLSLLWPFYVNQLAHKSLPDHVVQMYHNCLSKLPWHKFIPNLPNVELMVKVRTGDYPASCCVFLADVLISLPWQYIVQHYSTSEIPDIVSKFHALLFTLLCQLAAYEANSEKTGLSQFITTAESFNWNYIDYLHYDKAVTWYVDHCQPSCVLGGKDRPVTRILNLLRVGSGMIVAENAAFHPETPKKRCSYVKCIVKLLGKCSHLKDIQPQSFGPIVVSLISEVEAVVGTVYEAAQQQRESLSLCQEVLAILNICNPQGSSTSIILTCILSWLQLSPSTILLLPLLKSACRTLVSHSHMALVVEACIDAHFAVRDTIQSEGCGWTAIMSAIEIPELARDKFLSEAVTQGCYLTIYAWCLLQLPLSQSLGDEKAVMEKLVNWTTAAKPSYSSSSVEPKVILWWSKIFELMLRQLDYGSDNRVVVTTVLQLVPAFVLLGEDRSSGGIMGAIGLGKKSLLSIQMRLLCRAMAAFLAAQVPSDKSLRFQPGSPGAITTSNKKLLTKQGPSPSQSAVQNLAQLESLIHNKAYASLSEHIQYATNFVTTTANCIRDVQSLLKELCVRLYPSLPFCAILYQGFE